MRWLFILMVLLGVAIAGCSPNVEPIERASTTAMERIVGPAVEKATAELSTRTAQMSGQGSLINPGYNIRGYGIFGTGVVYEMRMNADGVSANIAGATQADQGQETTDPRPPGWRNTTQPANVEKPAEPGGS